MPTEADQLRAARDHLFQFRTIMRDLYGTYEKVSYVYSVEGAHHAVGLSYEAENFVESMLSGTFIYAPDDPDADEHGCVRVAKIASR